MSDVTDLKNYMPIGDFQEDNFHFWGWQPANDKAERVMIVQAYNELDEFLGEIKIPIWHPNIFGIDTEDKRALEEGTNDFILKLKSERKESIFQDFR